MFYGTGIIFFAILIVGSGSVFAEDSCVNCHKDEKFRVQNKILFNYYANWKDSVHDLADVQCTDCHGGNMNKSDKESAHKDGFSSLTAIDGAAYKMIPERCGQCHAPVLNNFMESKHYKALLEKGTGPQCVTCHGSMNAEVYYTSVVVRACKECHNEYTMNRPEIAGEADKILHRINVSRAYRNWISIYYSDDDPGKVKEMDAQYKDVADSWHRFDFDKLDSKSQGLLSRMKSLVNKKLAEKRSKKKK
jgi:hypothetical protein